MADLAEQLESPPVMSSMYTSYDLICLLFTIMGSMQVLLLIFIIAVSVRKPWDKRPFKENETRTIGLKS
jgi:hypothetical protein